MEINKYFIWIVLIVFLTVTACTSKKPNNVTVDPVERIYNLDPQRKFIGETVGDLHFIDILKNKQYHLDEINKEKIIMIQSFSVGCPACARGIKDYNLLYDKYEKDIEVIYMGINPDDTPNSIRNIKEQYNGKNWLWLTYQSSLLSFYEKFSFINNDMTLIIDKDGRIAYADSFAVPLERLENELIKLGVSS